MSKALCVCIITLYVLALCGGCGTGESLSSTTFHESNTGGGGFAPGQDTLVLLTVSDKATGASIASPDVVFVGPSGSRAPVLNNGKGVYYVRVRPRAVYEASVSAAGYNAVTFTHTAGSAGTSTIMNLELSRQ